MNGAANGDPKGETGETGQNRSSQSEQGLSPSKPVYIVDDDSGVRRSISFFLETTGYNPRSFASGEDLLDEAEALSPGVVLLDMRMPGLDGLEVMRRLTDLRSRLPVIVMTGHGDIATAVASMKLGASDFIEKPFDEPALLLILEAVFERLEGQVRQGLEVSRMRQKVNALSPREMDVLRGLVAGLANKGIARNLDLSVRTVEMHRAKLMTRLQVATTAEVVKIAILAGLAPWSDQDRAD